MRWLTTLVSWLAVAGVAQAQNEAQKLYEAFEQKLLKAKSYKFSFTSDSLLYEKGKGTLITAVGNRVNIAYEATNAIIGRFKTSFISDGKTLIVKSNDDTTEQPVPGKFHERLTKWLTQAGVFFAIMSTFEQEDVPKVNFSNFKLGAKEKIGDRSAQVIEYQVKLKKDQVKCKMWLDAQNGLPLKWTIDVGDFIVVEEYSNWELDPKLPEGTFTLPK